MRQVLKVASGVLSREYTYRTPNIEDLKQAVGRAGFPVPQDRSDRHDRMIARASEQLAIALDRAWRPHERQLRMLKRIQQERSSYCTADVDDDVSGLRVLAEVSDHRLFVRHELHEADRRAIEVC
jgi:hypothetical protein